MQKNHAQYTTLLEKFGTEMPKKLLRCTETKTSKAESLGQLQMMISDTVGSRAQMDLVDMRRRQVGNYKWIRHYVDHHSWYSHIACLKKKKAKTVGLEQIQILPAAVIPEILQSDNGGEFLGECMRIAREPSTQGSVKRGNKTFKQSLFEWMEQNKSESWAEVGAYIINALINQQRTKVSSQ